MNGEELYRKWLKIKRSSIIGLSLLCGLISFLTVGFAYLSKWVLDSIGTSKFVFFAILLGIIIILEVFGKIYMNHLSSKFSYQLENKLREQVFFQFLRKDQMESESKKDSDWLGRIMSDVRVVASGVIGYIPSVVSLVSRIFLSFVVLFIVDWIFALFLLVTGIVIYICSYFLRKKNKILHKNVQEKEANSLGFFSEGVSHSFLFRLFPNWSNLEKKCTDIQEEVYDSKMKQMCFSNAINGGFLFFMRMSYFLSIIYCALRFDAGLSVGSLFAMIQLIGQIEGPFSSLSGLIPRYYATIGSCERLLECNPNTNLETKQVKDTFSQVTFENVSFGYQECELILKNVNIQFEKGKKYVLIGNSGSGKSTLTKLLMGLYTPLEGKIEIDGEEIKNYQCIFAYVPQGNWLLKGTIRENLCLFAPSKTEKECWSALEIACLKEKVESLPNQLDTVLSDNGEGLSVGECQRLSFARAYITGLPFLVLDECTSSLDQEIEAQLLQNLSKQDKTILFISHRPKVKEYVDEIWELKEGELFVYE